MTRFQWHIQAHVLRSWSSDKVLCHHEPSHGLCNARGRFCARLLYLEGAGLSEGQVWQCWLSRTRVSSLLSRCHWQATRRPCSSLVLCEKATEATSLGCGHEVVVTPRSWPLVTGRALDKQTRAGFLFLRRDPRQLPLSVASQALSPSQPCRYVGPNRYRDRVPLSSPPEHMCVEAVTIAKAQRRLERNTMSWERSRPQLAPQDFKSNRREGPCHSDLNKQQKECTQPSELLYRLLATISAQDSSQTRYSFTRHSAERD